MDRSIHLSLPLEKRDYRVVLLPLFLDDIERDTGAKNEKTESQEACEWKEK